MDTEKKTCYNKQAIMYCDKLAHYDKYILHKKGWNIKI